MGHSRIRRLGVAAAAPARWRAMQALALGLMLALAFALPHARGADAPAYVVSVVPQFQAVDLHRTWAPVLQRLSRSLGVELQLKVHKDIPAFEEDLKAGHPDFAYMNPWHAVMARQAQGYVPLVRDARPLTGILVVRADDPIRSVAELSGKELAFPAPNAFGASLWMRAHLTERDKVAFTPVYARTHSNAYRLTLAGKAAATGGVRATLDKEPEEVRQSLRVLVETPESAPHPLSAHPRVPAAVQAALVKAVMAMKKDAEGQAALQGVLMAEPVVADYRRDYRPVEQLRLDKYVE